MGKPHRAGPVNRRWWARPLVLLAGVVLGANLFLIVLERLAGGTEGPASSSYATAPRGVAAYAELLARSGHPVERLRGPLAGAAPSPRTTVVLLDPSPLPRAEARALGRFVRAGGRLVAGGRFSNPWLGAVVDDPPRWTGGGVHAAEVLTPLAETAGLGAVRARAEGYWSDSGGSLPLLGRGSKSILNVAAVGAGRALLIADASILQNALLDDGSNAALGLRLAGEPGRPVVFVESVHGYGSATGVAALPASWRVALALGGAAAVLLLWARGRRLGPVQELARRLPPPRRDYVDSLAGALARSRRPAEALEPLQVAARRRLERLAGLGPGAGEGELRAAAAARGLAPDLIEALFRPPVSDADVMALGRAAVRLGALRRGRAEAVA
jgi:hypothetical protein